MSADSGVLRQQPPPCDIVPSSPCSAGSFPLGGFTAPGLQLSPVTLPVARFQARLRRLQRLLPNSYLAPACSYAPGLCSTPGGHGVLELLLRSVHLLFLSSPSSLPLISYPHFDYRCEGGRIECRWTGRHRWMAQEGGCSSGCISHGASSLVAWEVFIPTVEQKGFTSSYQPGKVSGGCKPWSGGGPVQHRPHKPPWQAKQKVLKVRKSCGLLLD